MLLIIILLCMLYVQPILPSPNNIWRTVQSPQLPISKSPSTDSKLNSVIRVYTRCSNDQETNYRNTRNLRTTVAPEIQSSTCHGRVNGHISDLVQTYCFTTIPCGLPFRSNILFYWRLRTGQLRPRLSATPGLQILYAHSRTHWAVDRPLAKHILRHLLHNICMIHTGGHRRYFVTC